MLRDRVVGPCACRWQNRVGLTEIASELAFGGAVFVLRVLHRTVLVIGDMAQPQRRLDGAEVVSPYSACRVEATVLE
jgi:hypothetical protein